MESSRCVSSSCYAIDLRYRAASHMIYMIVLFHRHSSRCRMKRLACTAPRTPSSPPFCVELRSSSRKSIAARFPPVFHVII